MTASSRPIRGHSPWQANPASEVPYGTPAPRQHAPYTCQRGHEFAVPFAASAVAPATWQCRCGSAAALDGAPEPAPATVFRRMDDDPEHAMKLLLKRRGRAELEELLAQRITEISGHQPVPPQEG